MYSYKPPFIDITTSLSKSITKLLNSQSFILIISILVAQICHLRMELNMLKKSLTKRLNNGIISSYFIKNMETGMEKNKM